uniref:Phospholipase D3-like n=1 Tax=Pundamilia nyererei TaxID=303518 RepID=A0A3B4ERZ1_9CICH
MNRKGGKPVSRIPTFQKRPAGASQSTELPVPRKDTPVHAQPPEKLGSLETSKSKPPGPRETALPAPLFHTPKIGFEAPSTFSRTEVALATAHGPLIAAQPVHSPLLTASPRPALRSEQVKSKTSETTPDGPTTHLPRESFPSKIPWEEPAETYDPAVKDRILLTPSGDSEKSAEIFQAPEDSQVEAIMDEEPPWETEPLNTAGLRDMHLVESIPVGLYQSSPSSRKSIADSWLHLLDRANSSVHIAAFYFTLRDSDLGSHESSDSQVFEQLMKLESKGVKLQIAVNAPQQSNHDTADLAGTGAEVREVDLKAITGGIVHTKLWVVDQKHFYVGSANMDWRSLSQVKEVGLSVEDCSCLAQDAFRIFGVYWSIGGVINGSLPPYWPARLSALSSSQKPLHLKFNGVPAQSAPPQISARGRSDDLSTILSVINDAQGFVYISVMDFLPLSQFTEPLRFWPAIDTALRAAACTRGVRVQLLVSCWEHSSPDMFIFLQSLQVLRRHPLTCDIDVKIFTVPSTAEQKKIPFARVNHAKYMVTDRVVYIGTSNWSENYFAFTAGVGLVVNQTGSAVKPGQQTLQSQAEELFLRDWGSEYASTLPVKDVDVCPRH